MITKNKYYQPHELPLTHTELGKQMVAFVITHELTGLLSLGCSLQDERGLLRVTQEKGSMFTKRYYLKNSEATTELKKGYSAILNDLLCTDIQITKSVLQGNGFEQTMISKVYGGRLDEVCSVCSEYLLDPTWRLQDVDPKNTDLFILGAKGFFQKPGENETDFIHRIQENIKKGPHFLVYNHNTDGPVGYIGTIQHGVVLSIYLFSLQDGWGSMGNILITWRHLMKQLQNEKNIELLYLKTRNKAVALITERFRLLAFLYTEHVYE